MADFDLKGFAAELGRLAVAASAASAVGLERAAVLVEGEAKHEIGHYQRAAGPFPAWPRLKPSTVREKRRFGYSPPDNPLQRTGAMAAGIGHHVEITPLGGEAEVGSNDPVAEYQEEGTRRMDARSFLGRAGARKSEQVAEVIGETVALAIGATRIR